MTTEVLVPASGLGLTAPAPYVLQSCVLAPPEPPPGPDPEEAIYAPVPPGVTFDSLPVLDTVTQLIDTSPDQIIGCANDLPAGGEQQTLDALFPAAIDGDGVVNRSNNDIWVYDGTTWNNVGPTPGPQVVVTSVLPPWNEIAIYEARIRTRLLAQSLAYALQLLTEPDPLVVRTTLSAVAIKGVSVPSLDTTLSALLPVVSISATVFAPAASSTIAALAPFVTTQKVVPAAAFTLNALAPTTVGRPRTTVSVPLTDIELLVLVPDISTGVLLQIPSVAFTVQSLAPVIAERVFGFSIAPVNFNLSDQPTGISLGSFPLQTL